MARRKITVDLDKYRCKFRQCPHLDLPKFQHVSNDTYDAKYCKACQLEEILDAMERPYDDDDGIHFAYPGGRSALRAENVLYFYGHGGAVTIYCPTHGCHAPVKHRDSFCWKDGTQLNQRNQACPTCETPDVLTLEDRQLKYQCDGCADRAEGYGYCRADY
jgi:hypothetical protein